MGWAEYHINKLKEGKTVKFRPQGNSMLPLIKSGHLCTVAPVDITSISDLTVFLVSWKK